jgi:hypothetical protein
MQGKFRAGFFFILFMIVSACTSKPIFTVEVYQTPTLNQATQDFTTALPTLTPMDTPISIPSPTPTPSLPPTIPPATISAIPPFTPLPDEESISPILYVSATSDTFWLLGGIRKNGEWLQPAQIGPYLHGGAYVDLYQGGSLTSVNVLDWKLNPRCQAYYVESNGSIPKPGVAVKRDWPVQTGAIGEISVDEPVYSQAVADWLKSQGAAPSEIHVTRIMQADLQGDGVNEVLVSATYFASTVFPTSQAGDYSVILLRKVLGNEVVTVPIVADFYMSATPEANYPNTYSLIDVLDLNRDGNFEIIVGIDRWEGEGAVVFTVSGGTFTQVLQEFCYG